MKMIDKTEECIGKYATKAKATEIAESETRQTERKHHAFLTHYHCPYEFVDKMCWTVLLSKNVVPKEL